MKITDDDGRTVDFDSADPLDLHLSAEDQMRGILTALRVSGISFVTHQCNFVPEGQVFIYRGPGGRFNVLGRKQPTKQQALAAISEFLKKEQERKAEQDLAKRLGVTIAEYRTWLGKQ